MSYNFYKYVFKVSVNEIDETIILLDIPVPLHSANQNFK